MKNRFLFFLLFLNSAAAAQYSLHTGQSAGMGGVSTAFQDVNSIFSNQAGLAFLEGFSAIAHAERRFGLAELQTVALGVGLPTRSGTFGLGIQSFGFEAFRQQKVGLSYARLFAKNFSVGAQFNYLAMRVEEYGHRGAITFEAGMQAIVGKRLVVGTHIFSPVPVEWADKEILPTVFKIGLAWQPNDKSSLVFEVEKDLNFDLRLKGGFEYQIARPIWLRVGFGTNPSTFHTGLGIGFHSKAKVDVAGAYHPALGYSPSASIIYEK